MKRFIRFPGLLISLAVAAASIFLYSQKPFVLEKLELAIQDCLFRLRGPLQGDARITLVAIDKKSIQDAGKWPWPRARLAELIQRISSASPALIVLDLLFAEESPEEVGGDRLLAEAMERAGTTVIPFLGGVQLLGMGVIGEYIGRVFIQAKNRPFYTIEERVGEFKRRPEPGRIPSGQ
jgi:CHASE2 domain-containing sensor protein